MVKKAISISLSLLIFLSSFGITLSSHYCGDIRIKSAIGIGNTVLKCGMIEESCENIVYSNPIKFILKKKCCENKHEKISTDNFHSSNFTFLSSLVFISHNILFKTEKILNFKLFLEILNVESPPLINQEIIKLIQTFRI